MMAASEASRRPMLEHAVEYVELGYPVFPVCSPLMGAHEHWNGERKRMEACPPERWGKIPLEPWREYQTRLPTIREVRAHWTKWPLANIGMATGRLSGIVVLDCDSGEARALAMGNGGLDETPAVWTGKPGGVHYWLKHPGLEVRNFVAGRKRRYPGLDFRGDGGYVLLPPSVHRNQNAKYRWNTHTVGMKPAEVPAWLMELLTGTGDDDADDEIAEAFDLDQVLSGIPEGARNDTLYRYAGKLRGDDVPQAYAEQMIRQAARLCKPPYDEDVAVDMIRRAYREYEPRVDTFFDTDDLDDGPVRVEGVPSPASNPLDAASEDDERWQVFDAADFLKIDYPVVAWRVEGFLRDRAIMFNFGAPGSIKTYIATDLGIGVATGGLFLGQYACQQGRVLIVQEDTIDSDFQQAYLGPLIRARGIDPEQLRGQLFVAPPRGMSLVVGDRIAELCAWLESFKPDLVIIDAFYLMHDGEGYGKDLSPIMRRIKAIRTKYGCAIWVIDHDRKGKGEANGGENPIDRLWGGRQKSAAVDAIMESRPVKGSHGETFLDIIKLRGAKPAEPIRVRLYPDYRLLIEGEGKEEEISPTGAQQTVYEWLCRQGGSRTKAQISTGINLSLRSVEGALYELVREGLARKVGKQGRAETWIALRKSEAEPQDYDFIFGDEDE